MNKLILMVIAAAVVTIGNACPCKGLGDAIMKSRADAAYAASWHYLNPAQQDRDWKKEQYIRSILVRELFGCQKHKHKRGA